MSTRQFTTESLTQLESASLIYDALPGCRACRLSRRGFLFSALGAAALPAMTLDSTARARAAAFTGAPGDAHTPAEVLKAVLEGNGRFLAGQRKEREILANQRPSGVEERHPSAIFLTCVDSRALVDTICDLGIGDAFNVQIAGNVLNADILGSMESATVSAGAKLVMVMGHTSCGVIKAAIDHVRLGHLSLLMAKFDDAIANTEYKGAQSAGNPAYVDAVAATHVRLTTDLIRTRSPILRELEKQGRIAIAGSMHDLATGRVSLV